MRRVLITGATGQIGSELTPALRDRYGADRVVAAGHREPDQDLAQAGPCCCFDIRNARAIRDAVREYRIDTIYHLASLLSAVAEKNPQLAWEINLDGLRNVLEVAREASCSVFFPSSIGAFGPETPSVKTPQVTIQRPRTLYGITKVAGELLCDYYHRRYGLDTRGLRFPGLISYRTPPGGGTTDYAVEIYYAALTQGHYACFLEENTRLDMMYMPDALDAATGLMEADGAKLLHRNAYNVTAMSFSPREIATEIQKILPDFRISYAVDPMRQSIAESWPRSMDDSAARNDWGWRPRYNLPDMTRDMLEKLALKLNISAQG